MSGLAMLFAGLMFYASAWSQGAASVPGSEPERWEWTGKVGQGQAIRVENAYGDVRARFGGYDGEVEIHAVIQNIHPGAPPLKVSPQMGPTGMTIRVVRDSTAPGTRTDPTVSPSGGRENKADRVDLVVRIPKGSALTAVTRAGAVGVKGLKGDVMAQSESGAISVREVAGLVQTRNSYGPTSVILGPLPGKTTQTFESLTGDISITLPPRADAAVRAETSGWITTDVSVSIVHHPREEPDKVATAKVGSGASSVSIKTKRGNVQILQMTDLRDLLVSPEKEKPAPPGPEDD